VYAAIAMACNNEAEFTAAGLPSAGWQAAPNTLFRVTWRIR